MLRDKIKANVQSGLLTRTQKEYLDCLDVRQSDLESLLLQDEANWAEKFEQAKKEADELETKIEMMCVKFQKSLSETLLIKRVPSLEVKKQFSLKKLLQWGFVIKDDQSDFDFEWPSQEEFDSMQPDTRLYSIVFTTDDHSKEPCISSVKINLTNGHSSPLYKANGPKGNERTIYFDSRDEIRGVSCEASKLTPQSVFFYDTDGNVIRSY